VRLSSLLSPVHRLPFLRCRHFAAVTGFPPHAPTSVPPLTASVRPSRLLACLQVAIKRISRVFQDLIDAKRILREIKLLRHLGRHDNIIEICDIMTGPPDTEDFHTLYIVMQVRCPFCVPCRASG